MVALESRDFFLHSKTEINFCWFVLPFRLRFQKDEALELSAKIGQSLLLQVNELKCRNRELKMQLDDAVEQVPASLLYYLLCLY